MVNLAHLPSERLTKAKDTLNISFEGSDLAQGTVKVTATANLGGTLFSRYLPLLGNYEGPEAPSRSRPGSTPTRSRPRWSSPSTSATRWNSAWRAPAAPDKQ